jgi:hypothetical protein
MKGILCVSFQEGHSYDSSFGYVGGEEAVIIVSFLEIHIYEVTVRDLGIDVCSRRDRYHSSSKDYIRHQDYHINREICQLT